MKNPSEYTAWNKPRDEWTQLPRATITDQIRDEILKAVQCSREASERLDRFNTQVSEETLRCRVW